ncbi:MAG: haloacid dehalogenase-like hydrolase [Candidatus Kapabacteria bacterium]|nr:haloacid dehalogenase-like hydrolase [Ignavibacteriota bacterium]MCW5884628.1 haloacid dehalogenase-like hydrolase [Candidatus Kapabacteria bacterium]
MKNLTEYKNKIINKLRPNLKEAILELEMKNICDDEKIAVFDLDNTLINGDIGDSLYCYLKSTGHEFDYKWSDYQAMLARKDYQNSYCDIITTMKGLNISTVYNAAKHLISTNSEIICFSEDGIEYEFPVPTPIPEMQILVTYLKISGWKVGVISASYHIAVKAVCESLFNLNPQFIRGVRTEIEVTEKYEDLITDIIKGTVTYRQGKADVFQELFGEGVKPLISAGDSHGDIELLNLTSQNGLIILCGKSLSNINFLKSKIESNAKFVDFQVS